MRGGRDFREIFLLRPLCRALGSQADRFATGIPSGRAGTWLGAEELVSCPSPGARGSRQAAPPLPAPPPALRFVHKTVRL